MNTGTYFIPVNYTDAGRVFGFFEVRNVIEAAVLGVPLLAACLLWVPGSLSAKIVVTISLLVPVVGFALIGLADDSLSRYIKNWWGWRKRRGVLTFRGEVESYGLKRSDIRRWC